MSLRVFQNAFHSFCLHTLISLNSLGHLPGLALVPLLNTAWISLQSISRRLGADQPGKKKKKKTTQLEAGTGLLWCLLSPALPHRQVLTQFQRPAIWSTQLQLWNTQIKFLEGRNYVRRVHQTQCLAQNRPLINTCEQQTP